MKTFIIWSVTFIVFTGGCGRQASTPPSSPANPAGLEEITFDLGGGVKLELVLIPAGDFLMGSPDSYEYGDMDARPQHRVRITKPFYLGKYEVTQEQWKAVMHENPSYFKGPKNPVEMVTWDECHAFLAKLTANYARGKGRFLLPTEAQWEYACRAGSSTQWCFGDDADGLKEYAWYGENSGGKTHPVGQKKPNAWGLYDMHGNVEEWCQDWYSAVFYRKSPTDDPAGPAEGQFLVCRGGNVSPPATVCQSPYRKDQNPLQPLLDLGLRVCLVPTQQ
jgi:formylglycine-generating enzyme required for sulfatase activity